MVIKRLRKRAKHFARNAYGSHIAGEFGTVLVSKSASPISFNKPLCSAAFMISAFALWWWFSTSSSLCFEMKGAAVPHSRGRDGVEVLVC